MRHRGSKIIVGDDEPDKTKELVAILERGGHQTIVGADRAKDASLVDREKPEKNSCLGAQVCGGDKFNLVIGRSPAMLDVHELVKKVAPTNARVLLTGESGTGKELIARCIHRRSRRRHASFFAINCAVFSENLIESELFGYERGAFTGAVTSKKGIFDAAHGGILFLDEVCETSMSFQAKLLRVIQEEEFLRVGGIQPLKTDVRILSCTNRDPLRCVAEGRLRKDLFYRLGVVRIHLPPLRERVEDILILATYFLGVFSRQMKKKARRIRLDAREVLIRYGWPGNVRELQNVIEHAVIMTEGGGEIGIEDLPADLLEKPAARLDPMAVVRDAERNLIIRTLHECDWNRSRTARRLGIGRRTLYDKMARLGICLRPAGFYLSSARHSA